MNSDPDRDSVMTDTCIVSFLFKGDTRAELYRPHLDGKYAIISFMTVAELDRWALERKWGEERRRLLGGFLRGHFAVSEAVDRQLCGLWAEITVKRRGKGRALRCADAWIAATAISLGIPLVTHNRKDFEGIEGLDLISESKG